MNSPLEQLSKLCRVQLAYFDIWGNGHKASPEVLKHVLTSLGVACQSNSEIEQSKEVISKSHWTALAAPVFVRRKSQGSPMRFFVQTPQGRTGNIRWNLKTESGETTEGDVVLENLKNIGRRYGFERRVCQLHTSLDFGYHELELEFGEFKQNIPVIVVPDRCFIPHGISGDKKTWGLSLQLYSLRSEANWGIGDFGDLRNVIEQAPNLGIGTLGLNPLHALPLHNPTQASPYSPTSRFAYNVLYLALESEPDFRESEKAQRAFASSEFQTKLTKARASELVDYETVAELKLQILKFMYVSFLEKHWKPNTDRAEIFRRFLARRKESLQKYAEYEALSAHLKRQNKDAWGWPVWPADYRTPDSDNVKRFAADHADEIQFYLYAQWLSELQVGELGFLCLQKSMPLGLYTDLAVGCDAGGADFWAEQNLYCKGLSMGAPPDELNLKGQSWGLAPYHPENLRAAAYAPLRRALHAAMHYAGIVRIDHVMKLQRVFCVPEGLDARSGVYLRYPLEELSGIVALESLRHQCAVIGEDLGTVPESVHRVMQERSMLSYKVFIFMRDSSGGFLPPESYPSASIATTSTHDLPTVRGFWTGRDIEIRKELKLFPKSEMQAQFLGKRAIDRQAILNILKERVGFSFSENETLQEQQFIELSVALAQFLSQTPARITLVQIEDLLGLLDQMNFPGVATEYPCWRQKLSVDVSELSQKGALQELAVSMRSIGR